MNPIYIWKSLPEGVRLIGAAGLVYLCYVMLQFDIEAVTDWRAYGLGVLVGGGQAIATAILAQVKRRTLSPGGATPSHLSSTPRVP